MSIPRKIHYCWLSGEPFPHDIINCIESWKRNLSGYCIKLWDKNGFDCNICPYTKQAMEAGKYAFVSDYIRLYALYQEGGIYLDSDIEVFKTFDPLLDDKAFTGFESGGRIAAWILASEPRNPLFGELLDYYSDRTFWDAQGRMDLTPNTVPVTKILVEHGLKPENKIQRLENITVYPEEFFCAKNPWNGNINIRKNTYAMHYFKGAWNDSAVEDMPFIGNVGTHVIRFLEWIKREDLCQDGVILYGLGVVGRIVMEQIRIQCPDLKIKSVLVSKRDNGWDNIDGIPIIEIDHSTEIDKRGIVLVSTTPKYHDAITQTLKKYRYDRVFLLGEGRMVEGHEDNSIS